MIFIDSDVFLIDLRYKRDPKFYENKEFLQKVQKTANGVTSIFNLLEICGVLSFDLNNQQLKELFYYSPLRYNVKILPTSDESARLPILAVKQIMQVVAKKVAFGDALIIAFVEKIEGISTFVSWNAKHFVSRLSIPAVTPSDFLKEVFYKNASLKEILKKTLQEKLTRKFIIWYDKEVSFLDIVKGLLFFLRLSPAVVMLTVAVFNHFSSHSNNLRLLLQSFLLFPGVSSPLPLLP